MRGNDAVFSLMVRIDLQGQPRVVARWEVLPSAAYGVGGRELALLSVSAMGASNCRESLSFEITDDYSVLGRKPLRHADECNPGDVGTWNVGSLAGLQFSDFQFEDAIGVALHGRWSVSAIKAPICDNAQCAVGQFVATFRHNTRKVKTY
tara:strand:- start:667 stop:1116 length:450 start_codon:yes stop_codon:yes gene_type:complete